MQNPKELPQRVSVFPTFLALGMPSSGLYTLYCNSQPPPRSTTTYKPLHSAVAACSASYGVPQICNVKTPWHAWAIRYILNTHGVAAKQTHSLQDISQGYES